MNQDYGTDFPEPTRFATEGEYVPSLTGEGKMSKSVEGSFINLTDTLDEIKAKIAKIPTDSGVGTLDQNFDPPREGPLFGVIRFVELFQGKEKAKEYKDLYVSTGIRYGDLKQELSEAIFNELQPIQDKRRELEQNPEYVNRVIEEGAQKARTAAQQTISEVKEKMGLK